MPVSNFPNGFANGLTIRGVPLTFLHPGRVFWVGNSAGPDGQVGSNANDGTYGRPWATITYAITQCSAGVGDIIAVKPGHTETISAAGGWALSKSGVAIIGLGNGSARPTITLDTATTATIAVSADNCSVFNCRFAANFLSIATCFTLTTAKYFTLQNCDFSDTSNVLNFLNCVTSTGAANTVDGLSIMNCRWNGLGTTSVNSFVLTANDIDGMTLSNNNVKLARTATAAVLATVTAGVLTNLVAVDNVCISKQTAETGGGLINVGGTTSTGIVARNYLCTLTTATDIMVTGTTGVYMVDNKKDGTIATSGFLLPTADS
jgi:hypothetical protein